MFTEPHSKRLKVKITIQKEATTGIVLQNSLLIEFTENNQQCDDCQKSFTPHIWTAAVQVRQKVDHKRTFLYLEQLILKARTHDKCIKVSEADDGLDFYFKSKSAASSLLNFIASKIPVRTKVAKQLISHDVHTSVYNYKYTLSCEIAPICRDDLVLLPTKLSKLLGGIGPLVLCYKISQNIHLVDVVTMDVQMIDSALYYQYPFKGFMSRKQLKEFIVIDIDTPEFDPNESRATKREGFKCVQVELRRVSDIGKSEQSYLVHSHLGETITHGDSVLCYDLVTANFSEDIVDGLAAMRKDAPDVVVVKKHYPRMRRKNRQRYWKLERMPIENQEDMEEDNKEENNKKKKGKTKKGKKDDHNDEAEFEEFLRDLEEDPELRQNINIYKNKKVMDDLEDKLSKMNLKDKAQEINDMTKEVNKKVKVKAVRKTEKGKQLMKEKEENEAKSKMMIKAIADDDESDLEEDFPAVQLNELMDNLKIDE